MRTPTSPLDVALAYHRAWTGGDMETAMTFVADEVAFDAPHGRLTGSAALIMYDTATPTVASAPAAEHYQVRHGLITAGRIIFDRLPFALARGEVLPRQD